MSNIKFDNLKKKILENKVLTGNIIGVIFLKGISLFLSFIMTPMYLAYFDDYNVLGVWYTIQSILMWILTFDLGLGNGIRNRLAKDMTIRDYQDARKTVSSGYIVLGITTIIIVILLVLTVPFVQWNSILNTNIESDILKMGLIITLIGIVMQFFFKVVSSILMALRKNILANLLPICTNFLILIYLVLANEGSDEEKFIKLAFVYSVATITPLLVATIYVFSGKLKNISPSIYYWDKNIAFSVLKIGGGFFVVQLGLLIVNSTNQALINYLYDGEAVVNYTLYYSLYSMAPMIFTLFTQPIWSEITIKYAQEDIKWINNIRKLMLLIAGVIGIGCMCVTGLLPFIFKIWLGSNHEIIVNYSIGIIFAIWGVVEVFIHASTCIANGMTKLKCQTIFTVAAAAIKIPLSLIISFIFNEWISVLIAHILSILPLLIAQNLCLNRIFKKID